MKIEEHLKSFKEHRDVIDWAIDRGLENSQRIIGSLTYSSQKPVNEIKLAIELLNEVERELKELMKNEK